MRRKISSSSTPTSEDRPPDLLMARRSQMRLLRTCQLPTAAARPSIVIAICFSSPSTSTGLYHFLAIEYILGTLYIRPMAYFNILQHLFSYHFLVVSLSVSVYRYLSPIYTSSYPCILHTHLPSSLP
ncbi:hypothetical protein BDZ97DRAFT_1851579 [Flammula alnicola]|nr:hypothetical protein BDZ97DRAFT_1851579 [Flammula alnicola]